MLGVNARVARPGLSAEQISQGDQRTAAGKDLVFDKCRGKPEVLEQHALEEAANIDRRTKIAAVEKVAFGQTRPVGQHLAAAHRAAVIGDSGDFSSIDTAG